ncbi:MAG TPA: ParB N-terminal domain-containing protein [Elusimicrobiota bacterium]|nr:ParB N-terminal domain-containing protein [Elusimicrobiota bacterium]
MIPLVFPTEKFRWVPISKIDQEDDTYAFGDPWRQSPPLLQSIRAWSVLHPVVLKPVRSKYQIISGRKRIRTAARQGINIRKVPAWLVPAHWPVTDAIRFWLSENRTDRELSIPEKSRVVRRLLDLKVPPSSIVDDYFPLMDLQPSEALVEALAGVVSVPAPLLRYLAEKDCPLRRYADFVGLDEDSVSFLQKLTEGLSPTLNDLDKIVTELLELSRKEDVPPSIIAESLKLEEGLAPPIQDAPAVLSSLMARLRERRYPELVRRLKKKKDLSRGLDLPSGTAVSWDPSLEQPGIDIRLHIQTPEQLKRAADKIGSDQNRQIIEQLLSDE